MTKFYCISLDIRSDRRVFMNELFRSLEIGPKYVISKLHPEGGIYGCFESHMKIWNHVAKSNLPDRELIVIFEDDCTVSQSINGQDFRTILYACEELLQTGHDIVHLGRDVKGVERELLQIGEWSFWSGKATFTHLYVITVGTIRKHIDTIKRQYGRHIDHAIRDTLKQIVFFPNIFQQRDLMDSNINWGEGEKEARLEAMIRNMKI